MGYNGTIDVISGFRPKNNGTFSLVSAKDIQVADDDTRLDAALRSAKEQAAAVTGVISSLQKAVETQGKNISDLQKSAIETDSTLKIEGAAADAKTVGDSFDHFSLNFEDIYNTLDEHTQFIDKTAIDIVNLKESVEELKNNSGESGSGGVSSWNDLTDKPFYYKSEWVTYVEDFSITSTPVGLLDGSGYGYFLPVSEEIYNVFNVEGRTAKFKLDGTEYESTSKLVNREGVQGFVYGNSDALLGTGNTGEPFVMIPGWASNAGTITYWLLIAFVNDTVETAHVCGLSTLVENIKKLDAKFHDDDHIRSIVDEVINEALGGDY